MFVPVTTAESALYRTTKHYRAGAGGTSMEIGVRLADCESECMADCMSGEGGGLRYECEPMCRQSCNSPPLPRCDSFFVDGKEYCCFEGTERCIGPVRTDGGRNVSCLQPGMRCCDGISYWPDIEVCSNGTVERCWPRPTCSPFGCCKMNEVCTDEGCVPKDQICYRSNRRCKAHEECTHDEGCVPRDQVCGPSNRRCKAPDEVCTGQGCCKTSKATSSRTRCCPENKAACGDDCCDECCPGGVCCNHPGKCKLRVLERGKDGVWVCQS